MPQALAVVVLQYCCAACGGPITATLRCEGDFEQLTAPPEVPLGCPHCGEVNDVTFDGEGAVHDVKIPATAYLPTLFWN